MVRAVAGPTHPTTHSPPSKGGRGLYTFAPLANVGCCSNEGDMPGNAVQHCNVTADGPVLHFLIISGTILGNTLWETCGCQHGRDIKGSTCEGFRYPSLLTDKKDNFLPKNPVNRHIHLEEPTSTLTEPPPGYSVCHTEHKPAPSC